MGNSESPEGDNENERTNIHTTGRHVRVGMEETSESKSILITRILST